MKKKLLAAACCVLCVGVLGSVAALSGCGASDMTDADCAALQAAICATVYYVGDFTHIQTYSYEEDTTQDGDLTYSRTQDTTTNFSYDKKNKNFVSEGSGISTYNYYDDEDDDSDNTSTSVVNYYYTNGNRYYYRQYDDEEATKTVTSYSLSTQYVGEYIELLLNYYGTTVDEVREYFLGEEDEDEDTTESTSDSGDYVDLTLKVKGSTYTLTYSYRETKDYTYYDSYVVERTTTYSYTVKNSYISAYTYSVESTTTYAVAEVEHISASTSVYSGTISYAYDETLMPSAEELVGYTVV